MKSIFRKIFQNIWSLEAAKDTFWYALYLKAFFPSASELKRKEKSFYQKVIKYTGGKLIFDIGANYGEKAIIFARIADKVVCVEPSKTAVQVLNHRFSALKNVVIRQNGVGSYDGIALFHEFCKEHAYSTFSDKWDDHVSAFAGKSLSNEVSILTIDSLILIYGQPDFVKIDVEGWEIEVIRGISSPIKLISFECNLNQFLKESIECIYYLSKLCAKAKFNYCLTEPPEILELKHWTSAEQMIEIVRHRGHNFMEIYCLSDGVVS